VERYLPLLLAVYPVMSVVSFALYASDKRRAVSGDWRISESTLLFTGLLGGWPGALIAMRVHRHKRRKTWFLVRFWFTVVLNLAVVIAVLAPELLGIPTAIEWILTTLDLG
jgi:uncharacterized membrane protein YsdA (DUF1294 family)